MNEVTISKAEYDDMKEAEIKHALLVDAIFAKARKAYSDDLRFDDVEEIMCTLYPETYARKLREVNKSKDEGEENN
jgi:hypothetical protein